MQENWTPSGDDGGSIEEALTAAVAAGDVDVAWVTVRSLSAIGVTGIDSLEAPLLIQTPEQQREVATGLAGEIVTRQLKDTDIEGLSIFPGPAAVPGGERGADPGCRGLGGQDRRVHAGQTTISPWSPQTITTLGGTPSVRRRRTRSPTWSPAPCRWPPRTRPTWSPAARPATGPFMTGTCPLFPVMEMVIINRGVLDRLSTRQHGFIEGAVERAQDLSMAEPDLATPVNEACAAGLLFGIATTDQFAALQAAVQPIYDALAEDPKEAKLFEAIQDAVKRNAGSGALPVPAACYWVAPTRRLISGRNASRPLYYGKVRSNAAAATGTSIDELRVACGASREGMPTRAEWFASAGEEVAPCQMCSSTARSSRAWVSTNSDGPTPTPPAPPRGGA